MSPRTAGLENRSRSWRMAYRGFDGLAAALAYTALYGYRKAIVEPARFGIESAEWEETYFVGLVVTILFWGLLHRMSGVHREVLRKSRLAEALTTLQTITMGSIVLFFAVFLDDYVKDYTDYYSSFGMYYGLLLSLTLAFRFALGSAIHHRIRTGDLAFPTLFIGTAERITPVLARFFKSPRPTGHAFVGWISTEVLKAQENIPNLPCVGNKNDLVAVIESLRIEETIIASDPSDHTQLERILLQLEPLGVRIQWVPDTFSILTGAVKLDAHGVPLVEIKREPLPAWQELTKRWMDALLSFLALTLLSPLLLVSSVLVRHSSPGPILFWQERLGKNKKPFYMVKFRSMYTDAESSGPQLSSDDDPRITSWGKIMRKYRLDELPQLYNVLKGDMSLVGPRPERAYFAAQILEKSPHYSQLYKIRPGLTSWGMVRYGYASSVEQMVERMEFDLVYLENLNLFSDLKVLVYTVLIVMQGRGK